MLLKLEVQVQQNLSSAVKMQLLFVPGKFLTVCSATGTHLNLNIQAGLKNK